MTGGAIILSVIIACMWAEGWVKKALTAYVERTEVLRQQRDVAR